jgi:hypothetical protein
MPNPYKAWFAPKQYGYGSSWPIAWQGWAALFIFLALVGVAVGALRGIQRFVAILLLVGAFGAVCALKTEGGWRRRWGNKDL